MASDLQPDGRSVIVDLDRANAARFGITPAIVDNALYDAYGQRIISTIFTQSNQYRVILDVDPTMATSVKSLDSIYLPSAATTTGQTPLGSVANFTIKTARLQISHLKQFPVTTISFNLAPGGSLGEAVDAIGQGLADIGLPPSFAVSFQGAAQAFQSALSNEVFLLAAAIAAMYIVLGVLYESFIRPIHDPDHAAVRGHRRAVDAQCGRSRARHHRRHRHRASDRHRQEERDHDDRLRARRPARAGTAGARGDLPGLSPTLAPNSNDDGRGDLRRAPFDAGNRRRLESFAVHLGLSAAIVGGLAFSQVLTLYTTPVIYLFFERLGERFGMGAAGSALATETP